MYPILSFLYGHDKSLAGLAGTLYSGHFCRHESCTFGHILTHSKKEKKSKSKKWKNSSFFSSNFDFCCAQNKNMRYVSMRLQKGRGDKWILIWLPPTLVRCCFSYFIHGHPPKTCHFYNIKSGIFETTLNIKSTVKIRQILSELK